MTEIWKSIPNIAIGYEVSSLGRIRSYLKYPEGHILANQVRKRDGYVTVSLLTNGAYKSHKVHALVLAAFVGPRPQGMDIRHLDGDKLNNTPENLRYGTKSENMQDAIKHGTHVNRYKTHCPRNHEYTPDNTYVAKTSGGRFCRECRVVRREAKRALALAYA